MEREYPLNVSLRQKWHFPRRNLKLDDLIIIKEDILPRNEWYLGRVIDVTEGTDWKVQVRNRSLTGTGHLKKLSKLERSVDCKL